MRLSAHLGYLFTEAPLERRVERARDAGFEVVEHPAPYAISAERLRSLLEDNGLAFAQMAAPMGDTARGEKGVACLPGREAEFLDGVRSALDYAEAIGCGLLHPMSGVVPAGADRNRSAATYLRNLERAAALAEDRPVRLMIEPISARVLAGYHMSRFDAALSAVYGVGADRIGLLVDTYHATVEGVPVADFVREHRARILHVHLADFPGRNEPGTGDVNFLELFALLELVRYPGTLGCEYVPAGRTEDGLTWVEAFAAHLSLNGAAVASPTGAAAS